LKWSSSQQKAPLGHLVRAHAGFAVVARIVAKGFPAVSILVEEDTAATAHACQLVALILPVRVEDEVPLAARSIADADLAGSFVWQGRFCKRKQRGGNEGLSGKTRVALGRIHQPSLTSCQRQERASGGAGARHSESRVYRFVRLAASNKRFEGLAGFGASKEEPREIAYSSNSDAPLAPPLPPPPPPYLASASAHHEAKRSLFASSALALAAPALRRCIRPGARHSGHPHNTDSVIAPPWESLRRSASTSDVTVGPDGFDEHPTTADTTTSAS
jgi:hypothetical protein